MDKYEKLRTELNNAFKKFGVYIMGSDDLINCVDGKRNRSIVFAIKVGRNKWNVYSHEDDGDILNVATCKGWDRLQFHLDVLVKSFVA